MIGSLKNTIYGLKYLLGAELPEIAAWRVRAEQFNVRAVFHLGHPESDLEQVTKRQKQELYPRLRERLKGTEHVVLDFGCGPGRFSGDLATMVGGRVIAVDPVQRFLDMEPRDDRVEYRRMRVGRIPAPTASVDIVWICLVLGGIRGIALDDTRREIVRVLKSDGVLFLVENTTEAKDSAFWTYRTIDEYRAIIPEVNLDFLGNYEDLGERISIFAGTIGGAHLGNTRP